MLSRADNLKKHVRGVLSSATVEVEFWECNKLLKAARSTPTRQFTLETTQHFSTHDAKASVCLVRLKDLATFLSDDKGVERRSILEPNVRGYQGTNNRVNRSIRETLESVRSRLMHQRPNPIHFFFQREMARVEKMELCTGNISFKEFSTLHRKDSIVFAPSDQRGGLLFTEILLPIGIESSAPSVNDIQGSLGRRHDIYPQAWESD